MLKKHYHIISLDDFFNLQDSNLSRTKPYAVITFDDGWADNYIYAFEELVRARCPAVVYLASDYIDSSRLFWPERLAALVSGRAGRARVKQNLTWIAHHFSRHLSDLFESLNHPGDGQARKNSINRIVIRLKEFKVCLIDELLEKLAAESDLSGGCGISEDRMLTWKEVQEMADHGLIIGSHTRSHTVLTTADESVALNEIVSSKLDIERHIGRAVLDFSFPNGQFSATVAAMVRKAGYRSAVTGINGLSNFKTDPFLIRRKGNNELRFLGKDGEFSDALSLLEWSDMIGFFRRLKRNPYH